MHRAPSAAGYSSTRLALSLPQAQSGLNGICARGGGISSTWPVCVRASSEVLTPHPSTRVYVCGQVCIMYVCIMYLCMHACMCAWLWLNMCIYVHVCSYVYMCVHVGIHVGTYSCMWTYMYVHNNRLCCACAYRWGVARKIRNACSIKCLLLRGVLMCLQQHVWCACQK